MTKKYDKKVIQEHIEHDELEQYVEKIINFVKENLNKIIVAAVIAAILIVSINVYNSSKNEKLSSAQAIFDDLAKKYSELNFEEDDAKAKELLAGIEAKADEVAGSYAGTPHEIEALLIKGKAYQQVKDHDKAIAQFEKIAQIANAPKDKARGFLAAGYAYENKAFIESSEDLYTKAIDSFRKAESFGKETYIKLEALYNIGLIYKSQGKKDQAIEAFSNITLDDLSIDPASSNVSGFITQAEEMKKELTEEETK